MSYGMPSTAWVNSATWSTLAGQSVGVVERTSTIWLAHFQPISFVDCAVVALLSPHITLSPAGNAPMLPGAPPAREDAFPTRAATVRPWAGAGGPGRRARPPSARPR